LILPFKKRTSGCRKSWKELGTESKQEAYVVLRATLHTLRDRLPVEETAHLGAQLPMLVRGIYYEGWRPSVERSKIHREEFCNRVLTHFTRTALENLNPEPAIRAVFHTLSRNISPGEVQNIMHVLPSDLRDFFDSADTRQVRAQAT
jgi:uncharacterized protein (DUF2267 family)